MSILGEARQDRVMTCVPCTGDEKASPHANRDAIAWKLEGLGDEELRRPLTPSGTSLIGLVKHLAGGEYGWFCDTFGRSHEALPFDFEADVGSDMRAAPGETTRDILAFFGRARAASAWPGS